MTEQIMKEVDKMNTAQKQKMLIQLRKEDLLRNAKSLDEVDSVLKPLPMTDEEADDYISNQRRLRYEQSKT